MKTAPVVAILLLVVYVVASLAITDARDFAAFYWSGLCVVRGDLASLYNNTATNAELGHHFSKPIAHYIYMPPFAYLMAPFALLPFRTALSLWLFLRVALLVGAVVYLSKRFEQPVWLALALTFMAGPVAYGHSWGQSNAVLLVLIVGAIACKRDSWTGVLWAGALMMKPIAGVLFLVFYRHPRVLLGAVGVFVVGVLLTGVDPWLAYLHALAEPIGNNLTPAPWNTSVFAYLPTWAYALVLVGALAITLQRLVNTEEVWHRAAIAISFGLVCFPAVEVHHLLLAIIPLMVAARTPLWYAALGALVMTPYLSFQWLPWLPLLGSGLLWVSHVHASRPDGATHERHVVTVRAVVSD